MFLTPGSRTGGGEYGLRYQGWIQRAMRWTYNQRTIARRNISASGNSTPQGRLTLVSGTPVMTSTQSAKTTLYYTPYVGDQVPFYDGTNMLPTSITEASVLTTDTTKNPSAIGVSKVNDWFLWQDTASGGTVRLSHGPDWASDSARTDALVMVTGIYLNAVAITNGPAAQRGTYVGTTRSDASSQLNWTYGSGGTAGVLGVWNTYNRVLATSITTDNGAAYTYTTATTRQARASAANQTSFVVGLQGDAGTAFGQFEQATVAVAGAFCRTGIGYNSTTAFSTPRAITYTPLASSLAANLYPMFSNAPGFGYNNFTALEQGDGTNANTFDNASQNTLTVQVMM